MAKNRIAFYTKEGRYTSALIHMPQTSAVFNVQPVPQNVMSKIIAQSGPDGSKLYSLKLNQYVLWKGGSVNTIGLNGAYFSLIIKDLTGIRPDIRLTTELFTMVNIQAVLVNVLNGWDANLLMQLDGRGNKYINLPPDTTIELSIDVLSYSAQINFNNADFGVATPTDPRAIHVYTYLEDY